MKKFLKKHLFSISLIVLASFLILLGLLSVYFLLAGCVVLGILFINFGRIAYKRYQDAQNYSEEEDYFDATKLDYDEDVYYIGSSTPTKKIKKIFPQATPWETRFARIFSSKTCERAQKNAPQKELWHKISSVYGFNALQ